ncbi:MAG: helix-turn-helix domain-containing protein [Bdellovibrionia bacterium]
MLDNNSRPKLVGNFIRQRREAAGLSQRALGMLFSPPVTTQFISNLERGVTPLPLNHVPTLTKALGINEAEMMTLLEQEYTLKLSGRLARMDFKADGSEAVKSAGTILPVQSEDLDFMRHLYNAYRQADPKTRQEFASVCENLLHVAARR